MFAFLCADLPSLEVYPPKEGLPAAGGGSGGYLNPGLISRHACHLLLPVNSVTLSLSKGLCRIFSSRPGFRPYS